MKFSSTEMRANCEEIQMILNDLQMILEDMLSVERQFLEGNIWKGQGATYYLGKAKGLIRSFGEIYAELQNMLDYLQKVTENYNVLDQEIANKVNSFLGKGIL